MSFYEYIGESGRAYPGTGYEPFNYGDVVDGSVAFAGYGGVAPADGRWTSHSGPATAFPVTTVPGAVPLRSYGLAANIPQPQQLPGQYYFATDTAELSFSDGVVWTPAGGLTATDLNAAIAAEVARSNDAFLAVAPAPTGTDRAALQALLDTVRTNGGGLVTSPNNRRTYTIDGPLVIGANTTLDVDVKFAAGVSSGHMLDNYSSVNPAGTASDGSIANGSQILTTSLASVAVVGQSVSVAGAQTLGDQLLVSRVTAVDTVGGTVTLAAPATQAVVSGGTVTLYNRDANIAIGGKWDRGSAGGTNTAAHSISLIHVDSPRLLPGFTYSSTGGKFGVLVGDFTDFQALHAPKFNCFSDGIHLHGPGAGAKIKGAHGNTGDNIVAVTCRDYTGYEETSGSISDVTVDDTTMGDGLGGNAMAVLLLCGQDCTLQDVRVNGIYGTSGDFALKVTDGNSSYAQLAGGTMTNIRAGSIGATVASTSASQVTVDATGLKDFTVDGLTFDSTSATTSKAIEIKTGVNLTSLTVENWLIRNCPTAFALIGLNTCTITRIRVRGCRGVPSTANFNVVSVGMATVGVIKLTDVDYSVANGAVISALNSSGAVTLVQYENCYFTGAANLGDFAGTTELMMTNVRADTLGSQVIKIEATGVVTWRCQNVKFSSTSVTIATGGSLSCKTFDTPVDLSLTGVAKANGDKAYNTNAALACGLGPATSNGTNWKGLYSGTTY